MVKRRKNIFASTQDKPSDVLRHALAAFQSPQDCMLMLLPHANSYRRFVLNDRAV